MKITGAAGDDTLTGTSGNDSFDLRQGGNDTASGLAGRDVFIFGATFTAADSIDGGAGSDVLRLDGDYSAGVTFAASTMTSVETLQADAGHSYNLTLDDANITLNSIFKVMAGTLGAGDVLTFNGGGVSSGRFAIAAGAGDDVITGSQRADKIILSAGGNDTVQGDNGNDLVVMGGALTANDQIDGGAGNDTVLLDGDYSASLTFNGLTIHNVETLGLTAGHSYNLTTADSNVAAGQILTVDGSTLGASDSLRFNGSLESNGNFHILAGAGNDVIIGGSNGTGIAGDVIDFSTGGNDSFTAGGSGFYTIEMGAALTTADRINGSGSAQTIVTLDGDYTGGNALTLTNAVFTGVNEIVLGAGHDYHITTATNGLVVVSNIAGADTAFVDESAVTTGAVDFNGGTGADTFIGGKFSDVFIDNGGNETVTGNGGNDTFTMNGHFTAADSIDGGAGNDTVTVTGGGTVVFGATTMVNVETLDFLPFSGTPHFDYTSNDATVAAGATLFVDLNDLGILGSVRFDGSAETDGHFLFTNRAGASGSDTLIGGALSDTFNLGHRTSVVATGGGGADTFTAAQPGNVNSDTFVYNAVSDSTSAGYDTIHGMNFSGDAVQVSGIGAVTGTDAIIDTGALSTATFDSDLAGDVGASGLAAHHAVLFTADSGTLSGHTFLVVDENGTAGYQAGADLVIDVTGFSGTLSTSSFT